MITPFPTGKQRDDSIKLRLEITMDIPPEIAEHIETLGLYQFEQCRYDGERQQMRIGATTTLYRNKGA